MAAGSTPAAATSTGVPANAIAIRPEAVDANASRRRARDEVVSPISPPPRDRAGRALVGLRALAAWCGFTIPVVGGPLRQGSRPKPGTRKALSSTSTPKPSPSRFNSRPSSRATVTPARPSSDSCHPVPLGAWSMKVVAPR